MIEPLTAMEKQHPEANALREAIKNLIVSTTAKKYISTSSHMDYKTGNRYQSLDLGGELLGGYRTGRGALFDAFDFAGKTVLDCGCNLGEMSRMARRRGAMLVDGIEYDPLFVAVGRLVNALNGISRVSVYQGDLTNPTTISGTYDVTLAFSVFPYILPVLDRVAAATKEVLVLETHDVSERLFKTYIEPMAGYFPFNTFVATTDFGDGESDRAVFAFAKDAKSFLPSTSLLRSTIDVSASRFDFTDAIISYVERLASGHRFKNHSELVQLVAEADSLPQDDARLAEGAAYWVRLMKGYCEYRRAGAVSPENTYFRALKKILSETALDLRLTNELRTEEALRNRVALRFRDADSVLANPQVPDLAPISCFNAGRGNGRYAVRRNGFDETLRCNTMDGYHRVFWSVLCGVKELPAIFPFAKPKT